MTSGRFTIEEADALVPRLELEFARLARCNQQAAEAARELGGMERALALVRGAEVTRPADEDAAARFAMATAELLAVLERVNALGCLIKDVDHGVVDFPSEQGGNLVHLCWMYGEPHVGHFHGTEEADAARQKLVRTAAAPVLRLH